MSRTGFDGKQYDLVFSDEFNTDNRTCKQDLDYAVRNELKSDLIDTNVFT